MVYRNLVRFFLSLAVVAVAAWIGSMVTYPSIGQWYAQLDKPFYNPPNWVFGPVWTVLYVLMAVSLYLIWSAKTERAKRMAVVVFMAQLVLNVLWSVVFFGLHLPWAAVGVIVALWLVIAATMALFWPISKLATWLLVPYLAWVSFATALTIAIAMLNPQASVSTYAECQKAPGSVILDSYPSICMTSDKKQFTNPDQKVDVPRNSSLSVPELAATIPLGQAISDAYYTYDQAEGDAYLTTTRLEDLLNSIKDSCTSGLHGIYIKKEAKSLVESARPETLCLPPSTPTTSSIQSIKQDLREAIKNATVL